MDNNRSKNYPFRSPQTRCARRYAVSMVLAALVIFAMGCTGFADTVRQDQQEAPDRGREVAEELYAAMVAVVEEETAGVDIAMDSDLVVISRYESLEEGRRRRVVGRVVPVGRGIGVKIRAEYQSSYEDEEVGELRWESEPREEVEEEAQPLELRIARQVEQRYHRGD